MDKDNREENDDFCVYTEEHSIYWDPAMSILSSCCFSLPVRGGGFDEPLESCGVGVCSRCGKVIDFYCIPQKLDTIADGNELY